MSLTDFESNRRLVRVCDDIILQAPNLQIGTDATYSPNATQFGKIAVTEVDWPSYGFSLNTGQTKLFRDLTTPTSTGAIATNNWLLNITRLDEMVWVELEKTAPQPATTTSGAQINFAAGTVPSGLQPNQQQQSTCSVIATATGDLLLAQLTINQDGSMALALVGSYGGVPGNFANATSYNFGTMRNFYYCQQ